MSYINVVNAIRSAALAVNPTGTFHNGRWVDMSQESITDVFPVIQLYPPVMSDGEEVFDSADIVMRFMTQDKPDSSMSEREAIINQMDQLATAFKENLKSVFKRFQINTFRREPEYQVIQGTLSGIIVRFTFMTFVDCVTYSGFGTENVESIESQIMVAFDAPPGARYTPFMETVPDWILLPGTVFLANNDYTFTIRSNSNMARSATILFTSLDNGQIMSLTVNQAGA